MKKLTSENVETIATVVALIWIFIWIGIIIAVWVYNPKQKDTYKPCEEYSFNQYLNGNFPDRCRDWRRKQYEK